MKFAEIASRITGFSIPVFGVSWNPPVPEVAFAQRLITFLEDRRVLFNDNELETPEYCAQSVIKIREHLTDTLQQLGANGNLADHIRPMRNACRNFLNSIGDDKRARFIINSSFRDGYESWSFFAALGNLRAELGMRIGAIAVMYGLEVEDDLAKILPPETN